MNKQFEYGVQELSATEQQLRLMSSLASNGEDQIAAAAAEVLAEAKLEQYYILCQIIERDPDLVAMYARALQRTEVIRFVVERQDPAAERSSNAKSALASLATSSQAEVEYLETFFTLFAPTNETYLGYVARRAAEQTTPVVSVDQVVDTEEPATLTGGNVAELAVDGASADDDDHTNVAEIPTSEAVLIEQAEEIVLSPIERIVINGEIVEGLSDLEAYIIKRAVECGRDNLRAAMFVDDPKFISLVNQTSKRGISTRSGYAQRLNRAIEDLNKRFEHLFYNTGTKGGARLHLSGYHTVDITIEEHVNTTQEGTVLELTEHALEETATTTSPVSGGQSSKAATTTAQPTRRRRRAVPEQRPGGVVPKSEATKLLPDGVMIDRRFTPFSDGEQVILAVINSAPRKEPYSAQRIATILRGQGFSVDTTAVNQSLAVLSSKMPDGWLVKVSVGANNPDGWRFAAGIRIVKQHGR